MSRLGGEQDMTSQRGLEVNNKAAYDRLDQLGARRGVVDGEVFILRRTDRPVRSRGTQV